MINKYTYVKEKINYEDYSSGRVLYGATGATNFPVRLSSEIYQHCVTHLRNKGNKGPYTVYDPFCGVAYSLTVIGLLHANTVQTIFASDADSRMIEFAEKNLSLLTPVGMNNRIQELENFIQEYDRDSHREARESAYKLQADMSKAKSIPTKCFQFNVLKETDLSKYVQNIDIIITDIPYGKLAKWDADDGEENFVQTFLHTIQKVLSPASVVAVIRNKKQQIAYSGYNVIKTLKLEKRKIILLEVEKTHD